MMIRLYRNFVFNLVHKNDDLPDALCRQFEDISYQTANHSISLNLNELENNIDTNSISDIETDINFLKDKRIEVIIILNILVQTVIINV